MLCCHMTMMMMIMMMMMMMMQLIIVFVFVFALVLVLILPSMILIRVPFYECMLISFIIAHAMSSFVKLKLKLKPTLSVIFMS